MSALTIATVADENFALPVKVMLYSLLEKNRVARYGQQLNQQKRLPSFAIWLGTLFLKY